MKPGHVFTIEPMINAGDLFLGVDEYRRCSYSGLWKDVTWPDDWTSTTSDGKRSAQFEHTMVITETGSITK